MTVAPRTSISLPPDPENLTRASGGRRQSRLPERENDSAMKSLALLVLLFAGACAQASNGSHATSPVQSDQPVSAVAVSVDCPEVDPAESRCGLAGRGTQW
jgi:hypothetical protein